MVFSKQQSFRLEFLDVRILWVKKEEEDEDELEEKSFEKAFKVVPRYYGKTKLPRNFSNFHFNHSEPLAGTHQVCRPPKPIFLNGGKP